MKRTFPFLLALISVVSINAQLLWKISGNGLQKPSFIFGTHHIAPISIIDSTTGFTDALNNVDILYGEIDMATTTEPSAQMKMATATVAPQDSTLNKVLSETDIKALNGLLASLNSPLTTAAIDQLKPAMVSNLITILMATKEFPDFNQSQQLDATIQSIAKKNGIQVKGLESLDTQIDLLFNTPISFQAKALHELIEHFDVCSKYSRLLAKAYIEGNLDELHRLITAPESGMTADEAERLITNRNYSWVDILISIMPTASIMAVVGAGHLTGENGLISLLNKKGFDVTPVK